MLLLFLFINPNWADKVHRLTIWNMEIQKFMKMKIEGEKFEIDENEREKFHLTLETYRLR